MSNTNPVFTEKQQRKTLSAKKKPPKAMLKNVLAQPLERYWPAITADDTKTLIEHLKDIALQSDQSAGSFFKSCKNITIGLNASLRAARSGRVKALLISAEIKPKYIVEQIIALVLATADHSTLCLVACAPQLTANIAECMSVPACLCVSICTTEPPNDNFDQFFNDLHRMTAQFRPVPKHLRTQPEMGRLAVAAAAEPLQTFRAKAAPVSVATINFDDLYLKRSPGMKQRAFVPMTDGDTDADAATNSWSDFISLSGTDVPKMKRPKSDHGEPKKVKGKNWAGPPPTKRPPFNYVSLSVHKVQRNPDKVKKMKKKKIVNKN